MCLISGTCICLLHVPLLQAETDARKLNGLGTDSVVNLGGNALHSCFHCRFLVELEMDIQNLIENRIANHSKRIKKRRVKQSD